MLQEVTTVRNSSHGKFWVGFSCGHSALCDAKLHKRRHVRPKLYWDCPFCFDFDIGDEVELRLSYGEVPVLAKFMGCTADGRMRFIFPCGHDDVIISREIVSYKKLR